MRIPETDDALLAECEIETYRSSGPGGQNVNRRETAVRLRHVPSGIIVTCQDERSQLRNRQIALARLRNRLEKLNQPKKKRIPTAIPRAVRRRALETKRRRARKKQDRRRPSLDD